MWAARASFSTDTSIRPGSGSENICTKQESKGSLTAQTHRWAHALMLGTKLSSIPMASCDSERGKTSRRSVANTLNTRSRCCQVVGRQPPLRILLCQHAIAHFWCTGCERCRRGYCVLGGSRDYNEGALLEGAEVRREFDEAPPRMTTSRPRSPPSRERDGSTSN